MCSEKILWKSEKSFMSEYGIYISDIYDGRGEGKKERHDNAKKAGCYYVIGPECREGHRLRTRCGHCIVCNPQRANFQVRYSNGGALYLATCGNYKKIGIIECRTYSLKKTLNNRQRSLNSEGGYGGMDNWKISHYFRVGNRIGEKEHKIQQSLSNKKVYLPYVHNGEHRIAQELYKCSLHDCLIIMQSVVGKNRKLFSFVCD